MEERSKKRLKRETLKKIVLGTVAAAGVLSLALVAPNALQILKTFGVKPYKRRKELIKRVYDKLISQGYLIRKDDFLEITGKGSLTLELLSEGKAKLKKPRKWDKKWRILVFDIDEKRRPKRDKLRRSLISVGFMRLQDSVWIYPYDCEDFVALLKKDFRLGKELLYLIVEEIEGDSFLRQWFDLPERED
ncbi:MAG: phenylacetic acid degradation operon negative regulatory protein [Parcubacteria group bacterium Gr01-1014_73]|nr:MAG: phenylacetic acid degradation operon negative regulatory protein [Parcubacteria group bacterium Gr01-1014_73]